MKINLKNTLKTVIQVLIILGIGLSSIWVASLFSKKVAEPIQTVVSCPLDSESYSNTALKKRVVLISNKSSYGENGLFGNKKYTVSLKRSGLNSKVACGYLYYRLSKGGEPIDQGYENLYMRPVNSQFGGHIIPNEDMTVKNEDLLGKTEIILPLNLVTFDGTTRIDIKTADWVSLLNVSDSIDFEIALNTMNHLGSIDSVELVYKCWNPQTGKETTDCNLEIIK